MVLTSKDGSFRGRRPAAIFMIEYMHYRVYASKMKGVGVEWIVVMQISIFVLIRFQ